MDGGLGAGSRRWTSCLKDSAPSDHIVAEVDDDIPGTSVNTVVKRRECLHWCIAGRTWMRVGPTAMTVVGLLSGAY